MGSSYQMNNDSETIVKKIIELIKPNNISDSKTKKYLDFENLFYSNIYLQNIPDGLKSYYNLDYNVKKEFTPEESKKFLTECNKQYFLYIGVSSFGDIIEVAKTHVKIPITRKTYQGDWQRLSTAGKLDKEYTRYVFNKTILEEDSGNLFDVDSKKSNQLFDKILINCEKYYEKAIFIPLIIEDKRDESASEIASEIERYLGEKIVKNFAESNNIGFIRSNSHNN